MSHVTRHTSHVTRHLFKQPASGANVAGIFSRGRRESAVHLKQKSRDKMQARHILPGVERPHVMLKVVMVMVVVVVVVGMYWQRRRR
jgi:hypothetical protein